MLKKDRKYYRIGEVSRIVGVEPHVLRFWEKEFRQIKPKRVSRQRLYRKQDLRTIERIKELLYLEGYTITGAKKKLIQEQAYKDSKTTDPSRSIDPNTDILDEIKRELLEIMQILSK